MASSTHPEPPLLTQLVCAAIPVWCSSVPTEMPPMDTTGGWSLPRPTATATYWSGAALAVDVATSTPATLAPAPPARTQQRASRAPPPSARRVSMLGGHDGLLCLSLPCGLRSVAESGQATEGDTFVRIPLLPLASTALGQRRSWIIQSTTRPAPEATAQAEHPDLCTAQCRHRRRCWTNPLMSSTSRTPTAQPTPPPAWISVREAVGEQPGHLCRHRLGRRRYAIWRRWRRSMA